MTSEELANRITRHLEGIRKILPSTAIPLIFRHIYGILNAIEQWMLGKDEDEPRRDSDNGAT